MCQRIVNANSRDVDSEYVSCGVVRKGVEFTGNIQTNSHTDAQLYVLVQIIKIERSTRRAHISANTAELFFHYCPIMQWQNFL